MKLFKSIALLFAGILALLFHGCNEEESVIPAGIIEGYVYYAGTTIAVPGVTVAVSGVFTTTNTFGYYGLSGVSQGIQTLTASKEGFDQYSVDINIAGKEQHTIEMLSLNHTSNISGNVSNQFNEAASDAEVFVLNPDGTASALHAVSDESGFYEIFSVPKGTRTILYSGDDYKLHQTELEVDKDDILLDVSLFEWGLPCAGMHTIIYEGQEYSTVMIGDQCWLKENLNVGTMIESCDDMTDGGVIEKYCYDDDPDNCDIYGGLYQWDAAMRYGTLPGSRGICPPGFHIPTDHEWQVLHDFLGDEPAGMLKVVTHWEAPNSEATNISGFSALPGGYRGGACALFYVGGEEGRWWSSTEHSLNGAWRRSIYNDITTFPRNPNFKYYGLSVRCVRDKE